MQKYTLSFTSLLVFICAINIKAQITFNQSNVPTAGDVLIIAGADTIGVTPGASGANQVWDFSFFDTLSMDTTTYITPAEAPNNQDFPIANLASYNTGTYFFYQKAASALWGLGGAIDFQETGTYMNIFFDPKSKQMAFPATYGTTFSDSTNLEFIVEDPEGSFRSKTLLKTENIIDGYGTVITPVGSFDALRMVNTTETIDSSWIDIGGGNWFLFSSGNSTDVAYSYLAAESQGPMVSIDYFEDGTIASVSYWLGSTTEPQAPIANYSYIDQGGGTIQFTDLSLNNPTSWVWDFGDGNTSTQQNPAHTFAAEGNYEVCLTATNAIGAHTGCETVTPLFQPTAAFTFFATGGGSVEFEDQSTNNPTSWLWDFGDGNTSTQPNPEHTYAASGTYTVCLTATNNEGSDTVCEDVSISFAPIAGFSFENLGNGIVAFTDQTANNPISWFWDFGDGNTSTQQNPSHTFEPDANYYVCLTVTNAAGLDFTCQTVAFTAQPVAAFSFANNGNGSITFQDESTNNPTSWLWDFGDGNTSTQQNPAHTYAVAEAYTVCLFVTNEFGTDFTCQEVEISFAPIASFAYSYSGGASIDFEDQSTNNPTEWFWEFGDGNTSTAQYPQYNYAAPGTYTICLTVTNDSGSDVTCQEITIVFAPLAAFTYDDQGSGTVIFEDQSSYDPVEWLWDFGDGNTSTEQNPTHNFTANNSIARKLEHKPIWTTRP